MRKARAFTCCRKNERLRERNASNKVLRAVSAADKNFLSAERIELEKLTTKLLDMLGGVSSEVVEQSRRRKVSHTGHTRDKEQSKTARHLE